MLRQWSVNMTFFFFINVFNPLFAVIQIISCGKWHFGEWICGGEELRGEEVKSSK